MSNYILINGAIRDVEELSLIIQFITNEIVDCETADISKIIISTWRSDGLKHASFIKWAESHGVEFIFAEDLNYGGPGNYFRQMRTLDNGVTDLDDSDLVFKTRTDKALLRKDAIRSFVRLSGQTSLEGRLGHKLAIEHISRTVPFMAKDMIMLGRADSIRKAISYTERTRYIADNIYSGMGPEVFMWLEYAAKNSRVSSILTKHDLRKVSNALIEQPTEPLFLEYLAKHEEIRYLYSLWIEAFRQSFMFLSEALDVREVDSWIIDEGSWKYEIGDKHSFEQLATLISKQHEPLNLNQPSRSLFVKIETNPFSTISDEEYLQIQESDSAENSDIVLIRRQKIKEFLANPSKDEDAFRTALKLNIRHRDTDTLLLIENWIAENDRNLQYVSREEVTFVLERSLDRASLRGNWQERKKFARLAKRKHLVSPTININIAETYYTDKQVIRATYWFYKAWKSDVSSLGANHGLGSILLDLRLNALAKGFLEKASRIAPQDSTAAWTLFRCLIRLRRFTEARLVASRLSGESSKKAEKILSGKPS